MLSSYSGSILNEDPSPSMPDDIMSQSLGPEQLKQSLMGHEPKADVAEDRGFEQHPVRPTRLFAEEDSDRIDDDQGGTKAGNI